MVQDTRIHEDLSEEMIAKILTEACALIVTKTLLSDIGNVKSVSFRDNDLVQVIVSLASSYRRYGTSYQDGEFFGKAHELILAMLSNPTCAPRYLYDITFVCNRVTKVMPRQTLASEGGNEYLVRMSVNRTSFQNFYWHAISQNTSMAIHLFEEDLHLKSAVDAWFKAGGLQVWHEGSLGHTPMNEVFSSYGEHSINSEDPFLLEWMNENLSILGLENLPAPRNSSKKARADWYKEIDGFMGEDNEVLSYAAKSIARKTYTSQRSRGSTVHVEDFSRKFFRALSS